MFDKQNVFSRLKGKKSAIWKMLNGAAKPHSIFKV